MRRKLGIALLAVGVLALVLAPLLRWYAYPRLAVAADEAQRVVWQGDDVVLLDIGLVTSGADEVTRTTDLTTVETRTPDPDSGDAAAVWDVETTTTDAAGAEVASTTERVAVDRRTGESVRDDSELYSPTGVEADQTEARHVGWYARLPFDTQPVEYRWWDPATQAAPPLSFKGEDEIDGLRVYRFEQVVDPRPVAVVDVPGRLLESAEAAVSADRVYSATRTLWVEPHTGAVIDAEQRVDSYLRLGTTRGPSVMEGTLSYDADTVAANVAEYEGPAARLNLVHTVAPVAGLVGGLVAVAAGLVLLRGFGRARYVPRRARRGDYDKVTADAGEDARDDTGEDARDDTSVFDELKDRSA